MEWRRWDKQEEKEGRAPGLYRMAMSVRKPTLGGQGASWRSDARGQNGGRGHDAGGKRKGKKKGKKGGLAPCYFGKRRERENDGAVGGRLCLHPLEACAEVVGPGRDDGDDGGGGVERSGDTGGRCVQAQQALTAAATKWSATTVRARGKQRCAAI